jgi:hypothetical protein
VDAVGLQPLRLLVSVPLHHVHVVFDLHA